MKTRHFLMMATLAVGIAMTSMMMTSCAKEDNPVESGEAIENENGKEELILGGGGDGAPMVGAQGGYIYDAKVLGCTDKGDIRKLITKYENEGWQIIYKDLNAGARGKYIYLAVKKCHLNSAEQGTAITDFLLTNEKVQDELYKDGIRYYRVKFDGDSNFKGDLNAGAGGATIRLFRTSAIFNDTCAVTKVEFNDDINGAMGLNASGEGYDLNDKTKKGEHIYMHMEKEANFARWCIESYDNCTLKGFIGNTDSVKTISIPLKFDGMEVRDANGNLPNLKELNYFYGTKVTYASAMTTNKDFKQVNVLDINGNTLQANALPESIEYIALEGFKGTGIEEIYLPYGLKKIDNRAFMDCTSLKTIYFGDKKQEKAINKDKWNKVAKGDDWNKNVHADFKVDFEGKQGGGDLSGADSGDINESL